MTQKKYQQKLPRGYSCDTQQELGEEVRNTSSKEASWSDLLGKQWVKFTIWDLSYWINCLYSSE